jgi:endonuclease-3
MSTSRKRPHQTVEYDAVAAPAETNVDSDFESPKKTTTPLARKKQSPLKKFQIPSRDAPEHWERVYDEIVEMRCKRDAPVDSMGTEVLGDRSADPKTFRFQTLVAVMLSSQTKDEQTAAAVRRLQQHGLSIKSMLEISDDKLGELIYGVGFHNKKIQYIKKTAQILHEHYNDDVPETLEDFCELPGVGPKMALIALNVGRGSVQGISVDVHVHRIADRLGWTHKANDPEMTRAQLEQWMPREKWSEINLLLVGFGQQICNPIQPKVCLFIQFFNSLFSLIPT